MSSVIAPDYLIYLDEILLFLRDSTFNRETTITDLYKAITGLDFEDNVNPALFASELKEDNTIKIHGTHYSHKEKLKDSLEFLRNEGLIKAKGDKITISSKGLIKTYVGSFTDNYKEQIQDKDLQNQALIENQKFIRFQRINIYITSVITIASLIVAVLALG